jgi:hypothetical protein
MPLSSKLFVSVCRPVANGKHSSHATNVHEIVKAGILRNIC